MKEMAKRTAAAALVGVVSLSMLAGCGEKELDGTATVATVDGTEIPLGVLSLTVRESQAETEAMYMAFMGTSDFSIWDEEAEDGKTYGEEAVEESLEDVELMYIMKAKASDYGVEITEEDEEAIAGAAADFIEANTEETLTDLAVNEEQVKTYLELQTYKERIYDPIIADVDTEVSDEEAQQSSFNYVSVSISDLDDDEIETKKEDLQKILDAQTEDPDADLNDTAQSVSEDYSSYSGTFDTYEQEDEDEDDEDSTSYSAYPDEVMTVLRTLDDGELGPDVIETDSSLYIVQLDKKNDEDATESQKETIISDRKSELYSTTTEGWLDDAEIEVNEKVLKTLKVKDNHKYTITTPSPTPEPTSEASEEDAAETADSVSEESTEATEAAVTSTETAEETAEEETTEEETAEATATPTAEATATPTAKATATPTAKATATPTAKATATPTAKATATPTAKATATPTAKTTATPTAKATATPTPKATSKASK